MAFFRFSSNNTTYRLWNKKWLYLIFYYLGQERIGCTDFRQNWMIFERLYSTSPDVLRPLPDLNSAQTVLLLKDSWKVRFFLLAHDNMLSYVIWSGWMRPAPTPAANAAPSAVVSLIWGRSTGTWRRSACLWSIIFELVIPPSTRRNWSAVAPSSLAIASKRSRVWKQQAS